jgi:DNA (cytosine-5)-methyltransferase 1
MKTIKVGSDFSGVGAFNQALRRLGVEYHEIFACDMDKFARETFIHNYGEPDYYPTNVYEREIPSESLDIYMTSPPCQAFSLAGKRLGKDDKRGVLFFNSHELIQKNQPRFFIFENVKGLLSDDNGNTFNEWLNFLGGKSVNGVPVLFPHEESVPYHLYWKVLNAKDHGVPQNRERVFLIGIRDDKDNSFRFPVEEHLTKRLKDVLEEDIQDKYFLSEKMLESLTFETKGNYEVANTNKGGQKGIVQSENGESISCLSASDYKQPKQILIHSEPERIIKVGNTNPSGNGMNGNVYHENGISPTLWSGHGEGIKVKSATAKGYEEATEGDSISLAHPGSETRRGRVGHGVAQTVDTGLTQGVLNDYRIRRLTPRECFRLMDFPETFTWTVSDSQAYKQAGNSIVVNVLYKLLKNLPL